MLLHLVSRRRLAGVFILPIRWLLVYSSIAGIMAAASLLLVDNLLLRWGLCALVVIPMALLLLKNYRKTQS